MPFQSNFRGDGMLERFGQCIWPVKNATVVHVGDGHDYFAAFGFATRRLNSHATLPSDPADGDFGQPLEEGVVEATGILGADGAGQDGGSGIRRALPLQAAHVGSEGSKHVACR